MQNKLRFIILVILAASIIASLLLWTLMDILNKGFNLSSIFMLFVACLIIIFAVYALNNVYKSLRKGYPLKDERTRKIETKAAALAFYIGIYWLLAISFAIDLFELEIPAGSVPGLGILGMAVIFGLYYWYFSRKGE